LSYYPLSLSKPQFIDDVSPGPHLPKEKEPSHCGDIGWDWFLLRQFDLQTSSFNPCYKLRDNIPFSTSINKKARYMLIFVDDFSRLTWIFFLRKKSEVFQHLKDFKALVETQSGKKIKIL
jgi:hypothetical protein